MKSHVLLVAVALTAGSAHAQAPAPSPLGLRMGTTLAELRAKMPSLHERAGSPYRYTTPTVPSPNSAFESYTLVVSPTLGLCKIIAIGADIPVGGDGEAVQTRFHELEDVLKTKYGPNRNFDFLHAGSIWDGPSEWMMALYKDERSLSSFWGQEYGSTLPRDLSSVGLSAGATRPSTGYVTLAYEFANFAACSEEIKKLTNASL